MKIAIIGNSIKTLNTVGMATLFSGETIIGYCFDTPNAIACAIGNTTATHAENAFGEPFKTTQTRIEQNKKNGLSFSGFIQA